MTIVAAISSEPKIVTASHGGQEELFALPAEEPFLQGLLTDVFETYWDRIIFGPIIEGAAYEIRCPSKPTKIGLLDGYLTIFFGRTHFHLCIGETQGSPGNPTAAELGRHRRTQRAEFYRGLNGAGEPTLWALRLFNGAGEQQMTVLFPNPFIGDDDNILPEPDWSRLAVWDDLLRRYLGREPDGRDRLAQGFACG